MENLLENGCSRFDGSVHLLVQAAQGEHIKVAKMSERPELGKTPEIGGQDVVFNETVDHLTKAGGFIGAIIGCSVGAVILGAGAAAVAAALATPIGLAAVTGGVIGGVSGAFRGSKTKS